MKLYRDMTIKLQVGASLREILYSIGVFQRDNMAPVLFVFVMMAFAESLEKHWDSDWEIETLEYWHLPLNHTKQGRILGTRTANTGKPFSLFYLLYMDDGAFLFKNKQHLAKGADLIYRQFLHFKLKMHIGQDGKKSKTEAMYVPRSLQEDQRLPNLDEQIPCMDGYITLTDKFKYLGSWISDTLKDDFEVDC